MKVSEIVSALEAIAPPHLAADWDNVGLLLGDATAEANKLLLCIDLTEPVLAEAAAAGARMVMAYHPIIFKPAARLTAQSAPALYAAARQGLAVYSMHTAWDAVPGGINDILADVLGLTDRLPLEPIVRRRQCKIISFVPPADLSRVAEAAFAAGAGRIGNYFDCAFFVHGVGSFRGGPGTHPAVGLPGRHEVTEELRLEVIAPQDKAGEVASAIRSAHSYEEPAVDIYPLEDHPPGCGLGRIGRLRPAATAQGLIARIKKALGTKSVLVAEAQRPARRGSRKQPAPRVSVAACCAGICDKLYQAALAAGATFYLTGEMRHHDALDAASRGMTVVCVNHSNSERLGLAKLAGQIRQVLPGLDVKVSKADRDPFRIV